MEVSGDARQRMLRSGVPEVFTKGCCPMEGTPWCGTARLREWTRHAILVSSSGDPWGYPGHATDRRRTSGLRAGLSTARMHEQEK
jgi:hypothetical protein